MSTRNIYGTNNNDILDASSFSDEIIYIYGQNGNDSLTGTNYSTMPTNNNTEEALRGGQGDDTINGGGYLYKSFLLGEDGNDVIYGGSAYISTIEGGTGNDLIYGGNSRLGSPNIYVSSSQVLSGGAGNDTIYMREGFVQSRAYGDGGDDIVYGGNGNDIIFGGTGYDKLYGGDGNDTFYVFQQEGIDYITGGNGIDTIAVTGAYGSYVNLNVLNQIAPVAFEEGTFVNDIILKDYIENVRTDSGDDMVIGNHLDNIIQGAAGNDKLYGGDGNDTIYGQYGSDLIQGGLGSDKLYGAESFNLTSASYANDIVDYSDSVSKIMIDLAKMGADAVLFGTASDSTAYGDSLYSFNNLIAGVGDDKIFGTSLVNKIILGNGNDEAYGLSGNDILVGEVGNDTLYGGDGNDTLKGGFGDDRLLGGNSFDSIYIGLGKDNAWGGDGADTFILEASNDSTIAGTDIIRDFNSAEDVIDLSGLGISMASVQIGASKTAGITGFNISANGVFSIDVLTGNTGDLTLANIII